MKKLIPLFFIALLCVSAIPPQVSAGAITNDTVTETLNMSWKTGLETVVQKIAIERTEKIEYITIPLSFEHRSGTLPAPPLKVSFGKMDKTEWPYVSSPIVEEQINGDDIITEHIKEITLNINLKLNGTYAIIISVDGWVDAHRHANGAQTSEYYYRISVGKDVIHGGVLKKEIDRKYSKKLGIFYPLDITYTKSSIEEANDLVMIIKYDDSGGGFWGIPEESGTMMNAIAVLGVAGIGGYFVLRRPKK